RAVRVGFQLGDEPFLGEELRRFDEDRRSGRVDQFDAADDLAKPGRLIRLTEPVPFPLETVILHVLAQAKPLRLGFAGEAVVAVLEQRIVDLLHDFLGDGRHAKASTVSSRRGLAQESKHSASCFRIVPGYGFFIFTSSSGAEYAKPLIRLMPASS